MKLYDGMRVRGSIEGVEIKDGKLTREGGNWYFCQNEKEGCSRCNKRGYKYSWSFCEIADGKYDCGVKLVSLTSTNIEDLYVGAKVLGRNGKTREVLGICGRAIFTSLSQDHDVATGQAYTMEELKRHGFTLVPEAEPEPEVAEVTMKEVCEKFGREVKIKKES
jgi:hypothetical protein